MVEEGERFYLCVKRDLECVLLCVRTGIVSKMGNRRSVTGNGI